MTSVAAQSIQAQIKQAKEQLKALQDKVISYLDKDLKLTTKIGEKGTINIYGLGKFPVCLYMSQAVKIQKLLNSPEFKKFIVDNQDKLAIKKEE